MLPTSRTCSGKWCLLEIVLSAAEISIFWNGRSTCRNNTAFKDGEIPYIIVWCVNWITVGEGRGEFDVRPWTGRSWEGGLPNSRAFKAKKPHCISVWTTISPIVDRENLKWLGKTEQKQKGVYRQYPPLSWQAASCFHARFQSTRCPLIAAGWWEEAFGEQAAGPAPLRLPCAVHPPLSCLPGPPGGISPFPAGSLAPCSLRSLFEATHCNFTPRGRSRIKCCLSKEISFRWKKRSVSVSFGAIKPLSDYNSLSESLGRRIALKIWGRY